MKTYIYPFVLCMFSAFTLTAQNSVLEYTESNSREQIKKAIVMGAEPMTAGGYQDGHGKLPLLTSTKQIPDTVALISLYIYDLGSSTQSTAGNYLTVIYQSISANGGNTLANDIYKNSISGLKKSFREQGVVLLTPEEFLNTPQKRDFYYNKFAPNISKLGTFLSGLENKHTDIAVAADYFRCFDLSASQDHLRSESLGGELAKALGVKGVMSIAVELQSFKKEVNMHGIKASLHGPNPIPKVDKKYIGQNMGTGYYYGQLYSYANFFFKKPISIATIQKDEISTTNFEGVGIIIECFVDKFYESMNKAIEKASKKYK